MTLVALCILPLSLIIVSNVVKRSQPFSKSSRLIWATPTDTWRRCMAVIWW